VREAFDEPVLSEDLFAPFPYYGNKRRAAPLIWGAIGDVPNYISCFGGALGELLARPSSHHPKIETANDISGQIANVWRSMQLYPEDTARAADWIVSELDLHARHAALVARVQVDFVEALRRDPKFCDPELAGWWIWGAALWIGGGWCAPAGGREGDPSKQKKRPATGGQGGRPHLGRGVHAASMKRPHLGGNGSARLGSGVHADELRPKTGAGRHPRLRGRDGAPAIGTGVHQTKLPHLAGPMNPLREDGTNTGVGYGRGVNSSEIREDILGFFRWLSARLRRVRIVCGDFERVLTPAVTISHGVTGVFLDPPYGEDAERCSDLYACDGLDIAPRTRAWALEHGDDPRYRIVLAGYEGEHDMPETWRVLPWKSSGGSKNSDRERLWISPHCIDGTKELALWTARSA
jgi:hypothetical protein